jgi:cell division protein FtsB
LIKEKTGEMSINFTLNYLFLKKALYILKNKYLLTLVGLAVWVIFFYKNDLRTQIELKKDVKQLEDERNYYAREISGITENIRELTSNPLTLEKFAREKYYMKRDDEDIFVIVEKK